MKLKINWGSISKHQKLSESFIEKHIGKLDNSFICQYQNLSEKFIEKYNDKLYLFFDIKYQELKGIFMISKGNPSETIGFIKKHNEKIQCSCISEYEMFKKTFKKKFDELYWKLISRYQVLSESFIEKHIDDLFLEHICQLPKRFQL